MSAATSTDVRDALRGRPMEAATRITEALEEMPGPGFATPRLTGTVLYPSVSMWRSRGRGLRSPFARFDGTIQETAGEVILAGRVTVPNAASVFIWLNTAMAVVVFVFALAAVSAAGPRALLLVATIFGGLLAGYLYVTRRIVRGSSAAETELLIREVRELVRDAMELDS